MVLEVDAGQERPGLDPEMSRAVALFRERFGPGGSPWLAHGPGRVNLIGEHTDYNDGLVLPMALEQGVKVVGRAREDDEVHLWASAYEDEGAAEAMFHVEQLDREMEPTWARYPAGVLWALREAGLRVPGFQAVVGGDLPVGAGLSSSAAIEVATALLVSALAGGEMPRGELARLCRRAENEFVGVQCGIMDQFASLFGAAGHAVFLDCRSLRHQLVPIDPSQVSILVMDTGVKHELGATEYHRRQEECREALGELSRLLGARDSLRDVSPEEFARVEGELPEVLRRRARHVVTENARVEASVSALGQGEVERFGALMDASHESLRRDYQVSCGELDSLVGAARAQEGCLGARMTGGGFGGAVVALVRRGREEEVARRALARYREETGREGAHLLSRPAAGGWARRL